MGEKLWQGRFDQPTNRLVEEYTDSLAVDARLFRHDIEGSVAHARMLGECGIISHEEASRLVEGLGTVLREMERGDYVPTPPIEDIHSAVEQRLTQIVGEVGGKLHTARSRNDQVALDMRLWLRDAILQTLDALREVRLVLVSLAEEHLDVVMPGFTHLQHAQPVLLSHHLMAYHEMLWRDAERLAQCRERADALPLGSAALAGTSYPIDMEWTAKYLGFSRVTKNSLDAVSDRDHLIEFCSAGALCMMHVSRLADELILWSTAEFHFIEISDAFCTGSSIMPQKKNPDVPELMRGKAARVYGNLTALLTLTKSLPLAYNRDLQEDKAPVFDTADTLLATLRILAKLLPEVHFNRERLAATASGGYSLATELADYLGKKGIPFRKAHHVVGQIVQECVKGGRELQELSLDEFKGFHKAFDADVFEMLDIRVAVDRRLSAGGTATERVRAALAEARAAIGAEKDAREAERLRNL